jgi:glycosyltransferase involved in cell wall biosynthesis
MNNDLEEDIEKAKNIEKKSLINEINVKDNNIKYLKKNNINLIILLKIVVLKKNYIKNLIFLLLLSYLIISLVKEYIYSRDGINENTSEVFNYKNETFLKVKIIKQFNSYIKQCLNGRLDNKDEFRFRQNPKISVIMPLYNGRKYLLYSLRSIQNQKFKDIEIILIDDHSTDDTINIIKRFMKEDPRIRLIQNDKNRKILYSKSIAALNCKGKYIIELDQDDMFIRNDCLSMLYYEAELNDLDLVHIRDYSKRTFFFFYKTKINEIKDHLIYPQKTNYKNQPMLKNKMFTDNNIYLLWGLLIKADLYKKIIYHLWPIIINYQIIFHEDYIITFMLVILAKKYKYLNRFAILHLFHKKSISNNFYKKKEYYLSIFFFANVLYKYHIKNNPKDINILINFLDLFKKSFQYGKTIYPSFFNYIISNILNNEYLQKIDKENVLIKVNITNDEYNNLYKNEEYAINLSDYNSILLSNNITIERNFKNCLCDISIILYCNEFKHLSKTINTLLNQKYIKMEIIIIYDNYIDNIEHNDLIYIEDYIKKFPFIKLINNKKIKGIAYSISIGVLNAKGKYILILQTSYTLTNENILNQIYNKSFDNNIDILEFNLLIDKNISLSLYKCSHIKSNINLDSIKYNKLIEEIDQDKELLVNKLIKTDLFKNIVKEYKFINYKEIIYNYFDDIFLFCLFNSSIKFEHYDIFGVINNIKDMNQLKLTKIMNEKNQKIKDSLFYINFLYDNSLNTIDGKKFALNELYNILSIIFNKFNTFSIKSFHLIQKFNNSQFINDKDKNYLLFLYKSLIN